MQKSQTKKKIKKSTKAIVIILTILTAFSLAFAIGCAANNFVTDSNYGGNGWYGEQGAPGADRGPQGPAGSQGNQGGGGTSGGTSSNPFAGITAPDRLVVYQGNFTILTQSFGETVTFLQNQLDASYHEWFDEHQLQYQDGRATFVARVISSRLDAFLDGIIREVGMQNIRNKQITATDVSIQHQDRAWRITALNQYMDFLMEELLNTSAANFTVRDQIQRRINETQIELNTLTTQQNSLNQQVMFSSITITLIRGNYIPSPPGPIANFFSNVWRVVSSILMGLGYALAVLIPLAIIAIPSFFLIRYFVRKNKAEVALQSKEREEEKSAN